MIDELRIVHEAMARLDPLIRERVLAMEGEELGAFIELLVTLSNFVGPVTETDPAELDARYVRQKQALDNVYNALGLKAVRDELMGVQ